MMVINIHSGPDLPVETARPSLRTETPSRSGSSFDDHLQKAALPREAVSTKEQPPVKDQEAVLRPPAEDRPLKTAEEVSPSTDHEEQSATNEDPEGTEAVAAQDVESETEEEQSPEGDEVILETTDVLDEEVIVELPPQQETVNSEQAAVVATESPTDVAEGILSEDEKGAASQGQGDAKLEQPIEKNASAEGRAHLENSSSNGEVSAEAVPSAEVDPIVQESATTESADKAVQNTSPVVTASESGEDDSEHSEQPRAENVPQESLQANEGNVKLAVSTGEQITELDELEDSEKSEVRSKGAAQSAAAVGAATESTKGNTSERRTRASSSRETAREPLERSPSAQPETTPVATAASTIDDEALLGAVASLQANPNDTDKPATPSSTTPAVDSPDASTSRGAERVSTRATSTAAPPPPDSNLTEAQRAQFIQRVTRAFAVAGERDGTLRVRLSPPELGSLRLEVTFREGAMVARLEAETPEARRILIDNLPELRERLAQQEIKVEKFDVDLREEPRGQLPEQSPGEKRSNQRDYQQSDTNSSSAEEESDETPETLGSVDSDQLDIVI